MYSDFTKNAIAAMMLNVTDDCNLCCPYCFAEQHPRKMELDIGIKAIKWVLNYNLNRENNRGVFIGFFGGEPTLEWDSFIVPLMKLTRADQEIVDLTTKIPLTWGITTNGQLLTEERIKFFCHDFGGNILLSIDGDRETQNLNRPRRDGQDSFQPILEIIPTLLKYQPNTTFRSTVIPRTVEKTYENYMAARDLGFISYFCTPNLREEWTDEKWSILAHQIELIYSQILDDVVNNIPPLNCSFLNSSLQALINNSFDNTKCHMRCGLGVTSIGISTVGGIIGCQEHSTYDREDTFFIGDIDNGIDEQKHLQLIESFSKSEVTLNNDCQNCRLKNFCQMNTCPSVNYELTGNTNHFAANSCVWNKILAVSAEFFLQQIIESRSEKFIEYLKTSTERRCL